MTIRRGEAWGAPGVLPEGAPVARSDAELSAAVHAGAAVVGLLGGDLCRTVGGRGEEGRLHDGSGMVLPVDAGEVRLDDGEPRLFVAHLLARRSWWRGPLVAVCNAQFMGAWDVAPRSHPNDGRLDVLEADLGLGDRVKAWRRLPTGAHVPHPGIAERRVRELVLELARPAAVRLDGAVAGRARRLAVRCLPDAFAVVV